MVLLYIPRNHVLTDVLASMHGPYPVHMKNPPPFKILTLCPPSVYCIPPRYIRSPPKVEYSVFPSLVDVLLNQLRS